MENTCCHIYDLGSNVVSLSYLGGMELLLSAAKRICLQYEMTCYFPCRVAVCYEVRFFYGFFGATAYPEDRATFDSIEIAFGLSLTHRYTRMTLSRSFVGTERNKKIFQKKRV